MMKKLSALMLVTAAVGVMAAPAVAGEREGAFSISPFIGGYTFDGVQHLETAPVFGLRLGYDLTKNWGVELVGDYLATEGTRTKESINALSYRLDILYNFMPDGPLVPYLAVGGGGISYGHGHNFSGTVDSTGATTRDMATDATANAGLGVKYFLTDSIALRGDARQLFVFEDPKSPKYNWEYTAGLTFLFGGKSAATPVQAQPAPPPPVQPPPAPAPTSKLNVAPGSITKGETAKLSWTSQNTTDCDITPGIGSVKPTGSMTITPAADTVYSLSCNGPGGTTNSSTNIAVAAPALPKAPTSSLSVTPNSIRRGDSATLNWTSQNASNCAIQPAIGAVQPQGNMSITPADNTSYTLTCEGAGGVTTSAANVAVTVPQPKAKLCSPTVINIQFDTNKSDIKPQYHDELKKLSDFLLEFPNAKGVIEGHTDSVGDKASNMKLSQRRAESVRNHILKTSGIAPERIKAKGFGPTKPVADNKTKEGKAQNRRIEANFVCD